MRPSIGCLIRFKDSAATLPRVLERLRAQTLRPDLLLGIDSGSTDGSAALIEQAGGRVVRWHGPYSHPATLNFGIQQLDTDYVLALSSHTVLEDGDALQRLAAALEDPRTACASAKWDRDPFYSDAVTWAELREKGLKFGSIYSNSMGLLRRAHWREIPFDESLPTAEDYAWALAQLGHGRVCRRIDTRFSYQRGGHDRTREFASVVFHLARRHGLRVTWLGARRSAGECLRGLLPAGGVRHTAPPALHLARLRAWLCHGLARA